MLARQLAAEHDFDTENCLLYDHVVVHLRTISLGCLGVILALGYYKLISLFMYLFIPSSVYRLTEWSRKFQR